MKFFHISDLHLGKRVNEFSMLDNQSDILQKIVVLAKENKPDAVLIAGDVYDKSMPSIEAVQFLAKEYGVTVFANDLWISATDNLKRFEEAGVADKVFPIHAEAHALPYADGFFDAAISIDSYEYYGTDELYFPCTYSKLVKPGGQFGIVVPALSREFEKGYPDTLKDLWVGEMFSFHSKGWWRHLWEKTGIVEITACYDMDDPKEIWWPWANWAKENFEKEWGDGRDADVKMLEADTNNDVALVVMSAIKK